MSDRVIGPSGGKRRRRSLALLSLAGLLALALTLWFAVGAGAVSNESGFEDDDANLVVGDGDPSGFDWNGFAPLTWEGDAPYQTADKIVSGWTFTGISDAEVTTSDSAFAGGVKQDDSCARVKDAKAPNKDDLKRIYLSTSVVPQSGVPHTYLNLAWARIPQNTTSASAHVAFEFNQGETACEAPSDPDLVQRTAGDMLVVYDFEGGSDEPSISLSRWITSEPGGNPDDLDCDVASHNLPCWGTATILTDLPGVAEAAVNVGTTVSDSLAPSAPPDDQLEDSEFGEAGIDLTDAGVITPGECVSFGTVFGVSRSSGNSGTAQMKDLVGPGPFEVQNCAPTAISTEQFVYPNDKATISVGSGFGTLLGNVTFELFDDADECAAGTPVLFTQTIPVSGGTTTTKETTNYPGNTGGPPVIPGDPPTEIPPYRITDDTTHYWKVSYDSDNPLQTDSESACEVETTTVTFVQPPSS